MNDYSNLFVCTMGIGTVFLGLICIIFLTKLMSWFCLRTQKMGNAPQALNKAESSAAPRGQDAQALVAAISAALAEELGTDVSGIRILSIKKCS